jgi:hypothetical protein
LNPPLAAQGRPKIEEREEDKGYGITFIERAEGRGGGK